MYKVIIFDFFGVFCAPMGTNWFKKTSAADANGLAAFQALCTRSDLGELSRLEYTLEAAKMTGIDPAAVEVGMEAEIVINSSLVAYTQELLDRGLRVACLSNGSRDLTLHVINKEQIDYLFESVILSADLGIIKPSPEIYQYALSHLGVGANEVVFVDDRQDNIDGAEKLGIKGLLFSDTATLSSQLEPLLIAPAQQVGRE